MDIQTNDTCIASKDDRCIPCEWYDPGIPGINPRCRSRYCFHYKAQEDCCTNSHKIATGCFWNQHKKKHPDYPSMGTGVCVALGDCEDMASGPCESPQGNCDKAKPVCN